MLALLISALVPAGVYAALLYWRERRRFPVLLATGVRSSSPLPFSEQAINAALRRMLRAQHLPEDALIGLCVQWQDLPLTCAARYRGGVAFVPWAGAGHVDDTALAREARKHAR